MDDAAKLIEIVTALVEALEPRRPPEVTLDRDLDRDLGLDSITRAELLLRVERGFGVALPEQLIVTATTPRDLLRALAAAQPAPAAPRVPRTAPRAEPAPGRDGTGHRSTPSGAATLLDVLAWHVREAPDRIHAHVYESADAEPVALSYADLDRAARRIAAALAASGTAPRQTVAIMLPTGVDYLASFLGVLMTGAVPVPIYPPARPAQLEDHLRRHARILENAGATRLITVPEARTVARLLRRHVACLHDIVTPAALDAEPASFRAPPVAPGDTALVQFTSGSTGQPKGVVLSHAQILANVRAMGAQIEATTADVFVSWLPLYHDMGLIGAWLGSLYFGMQAVLMSPLAFLARPERWLWAIHRHGGTLSAAPNFAYELCASRVADTALDGLDLSTWRRAFNGAEPVSPRTVARFCARFAEFGFDPGAMAPVYGLAEAAVGLAFPPLGSGAVIDRVDRNAFVGRRQIVPAAPDAPNPLEFVACGRPLEGYEIRIVGPTGRELGEREEGRLEFRGPSATAGYLRNPEATEALFDGDWLDSGDLAYVVGADVYLTGRVKDVIIRAGRNVHPYEVEEAVGEVAGVRKGCVAAFGVADPATGVEQLVVLAETREQREAARAALADAIRTRVVDVLGFPPDDVVLAAPRTVLKTSSGKIRRSASRELYERGALHRGQRSTGWQFVRLVASGAAADARASLRAAADIAYGTYVLALFVPIALATWIGVVALPAAARWPLMRASARLLLALARVPVLVDGTARIPRTGRVVYVANHASIIDGVAAVLALPGPFVFTVKADFARAFVTRVFLRRIGAVFVEREETARSLADAEVSAAAVDAGRPVLFFAEGFVTRRPGLRRFHLGAFVAAARAGAQVVPVAIRGTRSLLRAGSRLPRRGVLTVVVADPIAPAGDDFAAALALRDAARERILAHLGEPDLG